MRMNEVTYSDAVPFDAYGPGSFRLGGELHEGNLLVSEKGIVVWAGYDDSAAITALAESIDVVLIGTGEVISHPPKTFREALESAGIGVEPMATAQACRTYNVLLSEGRRVAAAVLAL